MAYCNISNIKNRIGDKNYNNITNRPGTNLQSPDIDVNEMINNASEVIDSYLRKYYVLPMLHVPYQIEKIATDITVYYLYEKIGQAEMKPDVAKAYEMAIDMLMKINSLEIILNIDKVSPKVHFKSFKKHIADESEADLYM